MKYIYTLLLLIGCGVYEGPRGHPGASCTVTKTGSVQTTTCPDGTTETVTDGERGVQGVPGQTTMGTSGRDGRDGVDGRSIIGPQGPMGDTVVGPAGRDGVDGDRGPQGYPGHDGSVIVPIVACPSDTRGYPEVMQCIDSKLYAVYDDGTVGGVHYTVIVPGNYRSTDGRGCLFTVTDGCSVL